eukprot:GHVN01096451.1.p1 GENE.GHVN01096451.1~~GHVN01096451.1.p1  ORF type:complete len:537 (-),score=34.62 GHVN01096451.1:935-2545(-)
MLNGQSFREKVTNAIKERKADEKGVFVNPYVGEKSAVLLETRAFKATPPNASECCQVITKVLHLLQSGGKLSATECTDLFFSATRLFQSSSEQLRRLVYLLIKSVKVSETEEFIVISSLTKDMNSGNACYRANAIRVLSGVVDTTMVSQIERYLKTAIVDKSSFVASSALICGINVCRVAPDVVKRWVNEVTGSISSQSEMVQFHALILLYELKKSDRLAMHKVVTSLSRTIKHPMAECMLIRYAVQVIKLERDSSLERSLMDYLESCLRHKSEMVTLEAAKAFCDLAILDVEGRGGSTVYVHWDIMPAITVLQIFLSSQKPVIRYGAVRILNRLSQIRPSIVSRCNIDMEPLLTDQSRAVATLALTTLLKTGQESNVDRLIKLITSYICDISDGFKIDIVKAVRTLCLNYPSKVQVLMSFLSSNLREEGSLEFKTTIVDTFIVLIDKVPQGQESGLLHLCDFIEDCEYPSLCTRILAFLGEQVPSTTCHSKFIRFIYNRLILVRVQLSTLRLFLCNLRNIVHCGAGERFGASCSG